MTYLEIVNKVLRKLREDTVTSVDYNDYSALIGEFVNDAKREVESAWLWTNLYHSTVFDAVGDTSNYDLSNDSTVTLVSGSFTNAGSVLAYDSNRRPMAFDLTDGEEMQLREIFHVDADKRRFLDSSYTTILAPCEFSIHTSQASSGSDGVWVAFIGRPEAGRTYRFHWFTPQSELEEDEDVISVPWAPVYHLATLYALDERGEEIGEPGSKAWIRYERSLSDSIALDAHKDPFKTNFSVP